MPHRESAISPRSERELHASHRARDSLNAGSFQASEGSVQCIASCAEKAASFLGFVGVAAVFACTRRVLSSSPDCHGKHCVDLGFTDRNDSSGRTDAHIADCHGSAAGSLHILRLFGTKIILYLILHSPLCPSLPCFRSIRSRIVSLSSSIRTSKSAKPDRSSFSRSIAICSLPINSQRCVARFWSEVWTGRNISQTTKSTSRPRIWLRTSHCCSQTMNRRSLARIRCRLWIVWCVRSTKMLRKCTNLRTSLRISSPHANPRSVLYR